MSVIDKVADNVIDKKDKSNNWNINFNKIQDIVLDNFPSLLDQHEKIGLLSVCKSWNNLGSNKRFYKGKFVIKNRTKEQLNLLDIWLRKKANLLSYVTELIVDKTNNDDIYIAIMSNANITTLELELNINNIYLIEKCSDILEKLTLNIGGNDINLLHLNIGCDDTKHRISPPSDHVFNVYEFFEEYNKIFFPKLISYVLNITAYFGPYDTDLIEYTNPHNMLSKNICNTYPNLKMFNWQTLTTKDNDVYNCFQEGMSMLRNQLNSVETYIFNSYGIEVCCKLGMIVELNISYIDAKIMYLYKKCDFLNHIMSKNNNLHINIKCNLLTDRNWFETYKELFDLTKKITIQCNCKKQSTKHEHLFYDINRFRKSGQQDIKLSLEYLECNLLTDKYFLSVTRKFVDWEKMPTIRCECCPQVVKRKHLTFNMKKLIIK